MTAIRYRVHFPLLVVAALIFWLVKDLRFPSWVASFNFLPFILMGALYAAATFVSLRHRKEVPPAMSLGFIVLAAAWSAATPLLALWTSILWYPIEMFLPLGLTLFIQGSIVGSLGYW